MLDITGIELTPADLKVKFDSVFYKEVCYEINWSTDSLKLALNAQIDVDECLFGAIGSRY